MIPKTFKLMGQTISVRVVPEKEWGAEEHLVGLWIPWRNEILIQDDRPDSLKQQVFCHELVHAILEKMGEDELGSNEKFVDVFGSLLHQVWSTAK